MASKAARTLRLYPRDLMTGDVMRVRDYAGGTADDVVIGIAPSGRNWTVTLVARGTFDVPANSKHTVRRSGPAGLGER